MSPEPRAAKPPDCPHRPPCPGCPRFGEPGIPPSARLMLDRLAQSNGLPAVRVVSGASAGFRLRARLAVRGRVGSPKIGLFEQGTHHVVHIPHCSVQHPLINRVAAVVRRALADARVTCYSDKAHLGLARHLQVVIERRSQTAQVVLVANSAVIAPLTAVFDLILERLADDVHSLWFNANPDAGNSILGAEFQRRCGPLAVIDSFGGADVHYPPGAFGQSNPDIAERIVEHVRTLVPRGSSVMEFYAGVGAIGLSILDRVGSIRMNEVSPHSLHGMELGIVGLDSADRLKVSVVAGNARDAVSSAVGCEVVIADPPRRGLDPEVRGFLCEHPPDRVIYVSCDPESLLRDATQFAAAGRLQLSALTAFNLMPFTDHVESVACFDRVL